MAIGIVQAIVLVFADTDHSALYGVMVLTGFIIIRLIATGFVILITLLFLSLGMKRAE